MLANLYYGQFDGIYMNPPYFESNSGLLSQEESVALALHEQTIFYER